MEKIPSTISTSWNTAATAPKENCHFWKRISIYKNTTINEPITAKNELFLISSAIVGPTLIEDIIPTDFSYEKISGLRNESIEKLSQINPGTLGQASRIPGVNPSDIEILMIMIHKLSAKS